MNDTPRGSSDGVRPDDATSSAEHQLEELRRVITGPERTELEGLKKRLDDPTCRAQEMSRDLPEAIALRSRKDRKLTKALMPTVEEALRVSVKKQPRILVDVIFPVMGPAIRKSIVNTLREMIQSLNKTLEHGLSFRGIRWRLEALRTGKSFAEVVLLHTLAYRVEQVFLIHKESGILLHHVAATSVVIRDSDMVSGMLTAIQDFVRDSFGSREGDALQTMQVGDLTVWIEEGHEAVLAAVIQGEAPQQLRTVLRDALDSIHLDLSAEFAELNGNTEPFERSRSYLEECLVEVLSEPERKRTSPLFFILIIAALVAGLGAWTYFRAQDNSRWESYLETLRSEPGVVIVSAGRSSGRFHISGLRDPLSRDPARLLDATAVDPKRVDAAWAPYHALEAGFILERARRALAPPESVSLSFEDGTLQATGSAPRMWIARGRNMAQAIPGVDFYQDGEIRDEDLLRLQSATGRIKSHLIRFVLGTVQYAAGQEEAIEAASKDISELLSLARICDREVLIRIIGHTDSSGKESANLKLSQERAQSVLSQLVLRGLPEGSLSASGVGSSQPVRNEATEEDKDFNRSVTFDVELIDLSHSLVRSP